MTFTFAADLGATGLEGTAGVTVYLGDVEAAARSTDGIEQIASSTVYTVTITEPEGDGLAVALVDNGTDVVWFETVPVVPEIPEPSVLLFSGACLGRFKLGGFSLAGA